MDLLPSCRSVIRRAASCAQAAPDSGVWVEAVAPPWRTYPSSSWSRRGIAPAGLPRSPQRAIEFPGPAAKDASAGLRQEGRKACTGGSPLSPGCGHVETRSHQAGYQFVLLAPPCPERNLPVTSFHPSEVSATSYPARPSVPRCRACPPSSPGKANSRQCGAERGASAATIWPLRACCWWARRPGRRRRVADDQPDARTACSPRYPRAAGRLRSDGTDFRTCRPCASSSGPSTAVTSACRRVTAGCGYLSARRGTPRAGTVRARRSSPASR